MRKGTIRNPELLGIAQVMLAALLWGTVGVATKSVTAAGSLPQEALGLARLAVGGPALLVMVLLLARHAFAGIRTIDPLCLACFAIGCAIFQICLFRAFDQLGVTVTVFLTVCLPPVIGTAWSVLRRDRSATTGSLVALGLASLGLAVFALDGFLGRTDRQAGEGYLLALIGSAAFVVMTSAARRLAQRTNPLAVAGFGLTLSALLMAAFLPLGASTAATGTLDAGLVVLVVYLGLGPTALAYVLYCAGMSRCRSANLGLVASMIEPAFAAVLAWAVLDESLTMNEALGCAVVTLAMLVLWRSEQRRVLRLGAKVNLANEVATIKEAA